MSRPELEPLIDHFPLRLGRAQIDLVDAPVDDVRGPGPRPGPDEIWAPVRVIEFDADGSIANILEQALRLVPHPVLLADRQRVADCIAAHVEVLTEVFARPKRAFEYGSPLPNELLFLDELLALRTADSRERFVAALRAKKRLGRLLG